MDRQLKALFDRVCKDPSLRDNTLILVCSDNGPETGAGTAGPFRGYKTQLYEGGIRSSLVAWGPGLLARKDHVNRASVFAAIDLVPTLLDLTGTPRVQGVTYDGESVLDTLLGRASKSRQAPLFFRRPPDRDAFYGDDDLPDLAVRVGQWKFLCEYDGSSPELYDLDADRGETSNVVTDHPDMAARLSELLLAWHRSMPPDKGADFVKVAP
jgi:uncharacterized sulfatase